MAELIACSYCGYAVPTRPIITSEGLTLHICNDCEADRDAEGGGDT